MAFPQFRDFITFDGGVHWQSLPGSEPILLEWLATYHGTTLAMVESSSGVVSLEMSTDQLQTWRELPQVPIGQPLINPATGAVVALGGTDSGPGQLYESSDLGQHWTVVSLPNTLTGGPLISPPMAGQPWRMCATATTSTPSPVELITTPIPDVSDERAVMCSMDGGKTWTERPNLITTLDNSYKGTFPQAAEEVALGADGSLYAQMLSAPGAYLSLGIPSGLYGLAPQATRWQLLGGPPGDAVDTAYILGGGMLWAVNGSLAQPPVGPFPAASV
jgi:Neuraminidase (sialidase)